MKKIQNAAVQLKDKVWCFMAAVTAFFLTAPLSVYADEIATAAEKAAAGVQATGQGALPAILKIAFVIIGFVVIIAGERGSTTAKQRAPWIIMGVICIMLGAGFADQIVGWFK
jgi:hypothetical protein